MSDIFKQQTFYSLMQGGETEYKMLLSFHNPTVLHTLCVTVSLCVCFQRLEVIPCCPSAGCLLKASCTGSSQQKVMFGASELFSGRSSPMENNPGTSSPIMRYTNFYYKCNSFFCRCTKTFVIHNYINDLA